LESKTYVNGDIVIISGVERSLDTESGGGSSERSGLENNVLAGVRDRKQMSARGPFEAPVLQKSK
jgi:hypothetical protein